MTRAAGKRMSAWWWPVLVCTLWMLCVVALPSVAQAGTAESLDPGPVTRILQITRQQATHWTGQLQDAARPVFWALAGLQLLWVGLTQLTSGQTSLPAVAGAYARALVTISCFSVLLEHGPVWGQALIEDLRQLGRHAASEAGSTIPQIVIDDMVKLCVEELASLSIVELGATVVAMVFGLFVVLVLFAVIGAQLVLAEVQAYVVLGAGALTLAFGGSIWTRQMALAYMRHAFGAGLKLMLIEMLQSVVLGHLHGWVNTALSEDGSLKVETLTTMLSSSVVLALMVLTIPDKLTAIVTGSVGATAEAMIAGGAIAAAAKAVGSAGGAVASALGGSSTGKAAALGASAVGAAPGSAAVAPTSKPGAQSLGGGGGAQAAGFASPAGGASLGGPVRAVQAGAREQGQVGRRAIHLTLALRLHRRAQAVASPRLRRRGRARARRRPRAGPRASKRRPRVAPVGRAAVPLHRLRRPQGRQVPSLPWSALTRRPPRLHRVRRAQVLRLQAPRAAPRRGLPRRQAPPSRRVRLRVVRVRARARRVEAAQALPAQARRSRHPRRAARSAQRPRRHRPLRDAAQALGAQVVRAARRRARGWLRTQVDRRRLRWPRAARGRWPRRVCLRHLRRLGLAVHRRRRRRLREVAVVGEPVIGRFGVSESAKTGLYVRAAAATRKEHQAFAKEGDLPKLEPWQREMVPWLHGAIEYSERYGSLAQEARRWRLAALCALAAMVVLACGLVAIARTAKVAPYVVQVDEHGFAVAIKPAEAVAPTDERVIIAQVARWVRAQRTVLGERGAQSELVDEVFAMLAPGTAAAQKTLEYFKEHDPYQVSERRVDVAVTRVQPMRSATHVTVEWTERVRQGPVTESLLRYSALVAVSVSPVRALKDVLANPLGVFVTDYSISQL